VDSWRVDWLANSPLSRSAGRCHIGGHVVTCAVGPLGSILVARVGKPCIHRQEATFATVSRHEHPVGARIAADIPCSSKSSVGLEIGPGGGFVVGGFGFEAAVEDADEAVAELAEGGLMAGAALAQGLVVGAGAG
jgi:hypothetical protein